VALCFAYKRPRGLRVHKAGQHAERPHDGVTRARKALDRHRIAKKRQGLTSNPVRPAVSYNAQIRFSVL